MKDSKGLVPYTILRVFGGVFAFVSIAMLINLYSGYNLRGDFDYVAGWWIGAVMGTLFFIISFLPYIKNFHKNKNNK